MKTLTTICSVSVLLFGLSACSMNPKESALKFNENKKFTIAQFTDVHWDHSKPNCDTTAATIRMVLQSENPDFAVLTGDIVWGKDDEAGWRTLAAIFEQSETPWAVVLGNHDSENDLTRVEIFEILADYKHFVGSIGDSDLPGAGNYILSIASSQKDSIAALLYFMDSHDYPVRKDLGTYDWIKFPQVEWYRAESAKYTRLNGGEPYPAFAFFHIPLQEYWHVAEAEDKVGVQNEEICCAEINSGLFASLLEMGDVMGTFVGHDHDNNYIGLHKGIALAYGQVTGANAYGDLSRGARIIELTEGHRGFKTWIRTEEGVSYPFEYK